MGLSRGLSQYFVYIYSFISCLLLQGAAAGKNSAAGDLRSGKAGYVYGQPMPVTCLNRTIDSGEHITDSLGKLQYIPFPTCNETFLPLALRYGVPETVNCTIDSLPDELYHLLEYYVHSDVPMTCRVPTAPLTPSALFSEEDAKDKENGEGTDLDTGEPSYTPLTFALQGTLQRSHLHIWTDMNVLVHNIPSTPGSSVNKKNKKNAQKAAPGYPVAGTAYSIPEFHSDLENQKSSSSSGKDKEKETAVAISEAARDPWTAGHGTKVIRGEPLTFTFHVHWVEGGKGIGWPSGSTSLIPSLASAEKSSGWGALFSRLFFFGLAGSVGAMAALYWERNGGRRRSWRGDGILGAPPPSSRGKGPAGIIYGNSGRKNGYGGFSAAGGSSGAGGTGYGGFSTGKRD
ncbi:uncharacterized protein EURHEDRAFT_411923 [Aspergillus ruber CBS 135680]|uniref:Uncharacterized protein n=1 Tax=Aspergillus ruber (strain CBS 135680) TaxID=1388766 RepID=A0A017SF62_ASPRC|nr:uncharacterized protein EURHEDRAFT_411923 [Aspergillus ruber CBS 135680]EYE95643.1 hypothetical protein EURHEDRAFT_411923 [Aspergillus ruber CBS 135680]